MFKINLVDEKNEMESMRCLNCRHWRDKAWTDKGWGICDNPKNEVEVGPIAMIRYYLKDDPKAAEELANHVEDGIRYPEDFGCIFFEHKIYSNAKINLAD